MSSEDRLRYWLCGIGTAFAIMILLAPILFAANYEFPLTYPTMGGAAEIRTRWFRSSSRVDSISVTTAPFDTTVTLDNDLQYKMEHIWFFASDTVMVSAIIPGVSPQTALWLSFLSSGGADEVIVTPYLDMETALASFTISSFPTETTYTLDGTSPYKFEFIWVAGSDSVFGELLVPGAGGSGGSLADCEGSGGLNWNIVVIDTAASPDILVKGAKVTCYSQGGLFMGYSETNGLGRATLAQDADIYDLVVTVRGFGMQSRRDTLVSHNQTDTLRVAGWPVIPAPGDSRYATVFVYYSRGAATGTRAGARLIAERLSPATDTTTGIVMNGFRQEKGTDSLGIASLQVPKSYIFHDSLKSLYTFLLQDGGRTIKQWSKFYVPDQDTVWLTIDD